MVMDEMPGNNNLLSIVIPAFNERPSLETLIPELRAIAEKNSLVVEIIIVDDGSRDGSWELILRKANEDPRIRGIRMRRNFGKAAALAAGFSAADGAIVLQMDGDGQDDPADIPRFLAALGGEHDIVNGWRHERRDRWTKILSSRLFNVAASLVSGLRLRDHNCGFKCFRSEVVKHLRLYGEMHRFIPIIGHSYGFRVAEIPISNRTRTHGRSKYGLGRAGHGFLDLLTVAFLTIFGQRPLHLLGMIGLLPFVLGLAGLVYLAGSWVGGRMGAPGYVPVGQRPLLMYSAAALLSGLHLCAIGFLAELLLSLNIRHVRSYSIAELSDRPPGPGLSKLFHCRDLSGTRDQNTALE